MSIHFHSFQRVSEGLLPVERTVGPATRSALGFEIETRFQRTRMGDPPRALAPCCGVKTVSRRDTQSEQTHKKREDVLRDLRASNLSFMLVSC